MISLKEYLILEMSNKIQHFKRNVEGSLNPMIPHICICIYCVLYDEDNIYLNHWKDEVCGWLKKLIRETLKNKADKFEIIKLVLIENQYNSKDKLIKIISKKFQKDNIKTTKDIIDIIASIFIGKIDDFIEFLQTLTEYNIEEKFNEYLENIAKYKDEEY